MNKNIVVVFNPQNEEDTRAAISAAMAYKSNGFDNVILDPETNLIGAAALKLLLLRNEHNAKFTYTYNNTFILYQG